MTFGHKINRQNIAKHFCGLYFVPIKDVLIMDTIRDSLTTYNKKI